MKEVYAATEERLLNLKSVKTYDAEDRDLALFARLCRSVTDQAEQSSRHEAAAAFWFEAGTLAALAAVLLVALELLHLSAAATLVMLAIFSRLMPQLSSIFSQLHTFAADVPAFSNIIAIRTECLDHAEFPILEDAAVPVLKESLQLESVSFSYGASEILHEVNLTVEEGKITAIMGASGAGKSTLTDLANGLLFPSNGRLLLDGVPLTAEATRQWRRRVGYVGQDTVLFHDSIRNNLLWARPDATEAELREALRLAAAGFVFDSESGLNSMVGDRGILLSSGQRQRIALARALLRNPELLILDEATNALDVENEQRILEAIQSLRGRMTILMVAHRLSAIRHADVIYLMEAGRIVESGTWESLQLEAGARETKLRKAILE
jgi:ATP-binding cassette subfamily C protein